MAPVFTIHARERALERFGVSIEELWNTHMRSLSANEYGRLRSASPDKGVKIDAQRKRGFYLRITSRGAIFVIAPPKIVLTVLKGFPDWKGDHVR